MQASEPDSTPLLRRRLALSLGREEVARRACIDPVTVWRIETGRAVPRRSTALLLANALRCDPADLFPDQPAAG